MSEDGYTGGLRVVADQLLDRATVLARFAKELRLSCNGGSNGSDGQRLLALLKPYVNGNTAVTVDYQNDCARGELELGLAWKVTLDEHLLAALRDWLAPENVDIVWDPPPPTAPAYRLNQSAEY